MSSKTLLYIVLGILTLSVVFLYWMIFAMHGRISKLESRRSVTATSSAMLVSDESGKIIERNVTFVGPTQDCTDCPDRITNLEDEITDLKIAVESMEKGQTSVSQTSSVREVFVPLGSGSTKEKDWTDIPGASAYIDTNNYAGISSVNFEGSFRIPQGVGTEYIRLYNKTADRPVWFSEQSTESATASSFQSSQISLDSGNNLYQVQVKSTIGAEAFVDSARVKIQLQ